LPVQEDGRFAVSGGWAFADYTGYFFNAMIIISLLLLVCNLLGISLFPAVTLVRMRAHCWVSRLHMDLVFRVVAKADLLATWSVFVQLQFALHWVIVYIVAIFGAILAIKVGKLMLLAWLPAEWAIVMQDALATFY
jgi:hypothetical protein